MPQKCFVRWKQWKYFGCLIKWTQYLGSFSVGQFQYIWIFYGVHVLINWVYAHAISITQLRTGLKEFVLQI